MVNYTPINFEHVKGFKVFMLLSLPTHLLINQDNNLKLTVLSQDLLIIF